MYIYKLKFNITNITNIQNIRSILIFVILVYFIKKIDLHIKNYII
jgi:hypothetical protein